MKRLLLIVFALAALAAPAQTGTITVYTGTRFEFTDCSSGGSSAQSVTRGSYLFRVTTEDVWICFAATCAAGGEKYGAGTTFVQWFDATTSVSCRSAGSTGDAIFTRAVPR